MQVASTLIGTAVTGAIKNAQESLGTPNRMLQTYLDTAPSLTISPDTLDPVVLFAGKAPPDILLLPACAVRLVPCETALGSRRAICVWHETDTPGVLSA